MSEQDKCLIEPLTPWQKTTPGGIITSAGNAKYYNTGGWRSEKPLWLEEKCKQCALCFPVCPDSSIRREHEAMVGVDYDHCKGCLVCVEVCPFDALVKASVEEGSDE